VWEEKHMRIYHFKEGQEEEQQYFRPVPYSKIRIEKTAVVNMNITY
jgi:hypothetical protein